jgi:hypothetical protein
MSETMTATEINDAAEASRAARTAEVANAPKPATKKPAAKAAPKPAPKPAPAARKALTPRERAARPVTATVASYVAWLNKTVYAGKMTKAQIEAAGVSLTLYGAYQKSTERRAERGV